jgi:hypothetical protein
MAHRRLVRFLVLTALALAGAAALREDHYAQTLWLMGALVVVPVVALWPSEDVKKKLKALSAALAEEFFATLFGVVVRALFRKAMRFLEFIFSH